MLAELSRLDAFPQPAPGPEQRLIALAFSGGSDMADDAADRLVGMVWAGDVGAPFDPRWLP